MISDTLFDAQKEIVGYLAGDTYTGETRQKIERLLEDMDVVRNLPEFDTPPWRTPPPRRTAQEIIASFRPPAGAEALVSASFEPAPEPQTATPVSPGMKGGTQAFEDALPALKSGWKIKP
jgi:hypothetical protein